MQCESARWAAAALVTMAAALAVQLPAVPSQAADLGGQDQIYVEPHERPLAIERWTGFYVGGTLGYGWGNGQTGGDIGSMAFSQSGAVGTVLAGYNWQIRDLVLGVEADVGTGGMRSREPTAFGTFESSLNSFGSFRGRAGFLVWPSLMLYGTAGLAWADMDFRLLGDKAASETFLGYQVGLGGEMKISEHVNLRLEYLYTGLPSEHVVHSGLSDTYDPSFNTVRAGLTFKF